MDKASNKAKSLELRKNEMVCPNCKKILKLSDHLMNEKYIRCSSCDNVVSNAIFQKNNNKYAKEYVFNFKLLIFLLTIVSIGFVYHDYHSEESYFFEREEEPYIDENGVDYSKPVTTIQLKGRDGEVISESTINTYSNEDKIPEEDFEFSEEWRKKAYQAAKDCLEYIFKQEKSDCYPSSFGYYNPSRVKYIGDKGYRVSLYYGMICKDDKDYVHRKHMSIEVFYDESSSDFKYIVLKDRYDE